jgi:hypothetical protein
LTSTVDWCIILPSSIGCHVDIPSRNQSKFMGVEIFTRWKGQTAPRAQSSVGVQWSTDVGCIGYLLEQYHVGSYASEVLVAEAFKTEMRGVAIPAKLLRRRLPAALSIDEKRTREQARATDEDVAVIKKSFTDFVELCEEKESATGEPITFHARF